MPHRAANTNASLTDHNASASRQDGRTSAHAVVVRIPAELLARIDEAVQQRDVRVPRHTWLLEAITEKLMRDEHSGLPAARAGRRRHGTE